MHDLILKTYVRLQDVISREDGQDLVEYALVVSLLAFGSVAGMHALSGGINSAFNTVSTKLMSNI
jgi:pilus assembly protein Flp/PilA